MVTGNKGEWSELYAVSKGVLDGFLNIGDVDLKHTGESYNVIKGSKEQDGYRILFQKESESVNILREDSFGVHLIQKVSIDKFEDFSLRLFNGIIKGRGKSFKIPEINPEIDAFQIKRIKEVPGNKADLKFEIYDHRLGMPTDLGFSVKSIVGSKPTLFNTGKGNNFIYNVEGGTEELCLDKFNAETYNPKLYNSKISERVKSLYSKGFQFIYERIESDNLWMNLKMVDGDMPEILGYALLFRWGLETNSVKEISKILEAFDPLNYYNGTLNNRRFYENKIKRFLVECALGMTSEKPWLGDYDNIGGVVVVQKNGELICFHIYDFNIFRNYLLNNTKFEQPATGESEKNPGSINPNAGKKYFWGWLYEEAGKQKFKINLQIRFT